MRIDRSNQQTHRAFSIKNDHGCPYEFCTCQERRICHDGYWGWHVAIFIRALFRHCGVAMHLVTNQVIGLVSVRWRYLSACGIEVAIFMNKSFRLTASARTLHQNSFSHSARISCTIHLCITNQCFSQLFNYRASIYASAVLEVVILSVRHTRVLWQPWGGRPLLSEICAQRDPPHRKTPTLTDFRL